MKERGTPLASLVQNVESFGDELLHKKAVLGTLLFIGSESIFFAMLVAAYVFYTGSSPNGPNAREVLDPLKTGFYTACLWSSSITVWLAERAGKQRKRSVGWWLAATMFLGLVFLYGEGREYAKMLHENVTVSRNLFGSTYYTLTGFHALHVSGGLILLGTMLMISMRRELGRPQLTALTCISYYWHFVDAVWVAVFSAVYLWSTR